MIKVKNEGAGLGALDFTKAYDAIEMLKTGSGRGSEFTGWINLPFDYDRDEFRRIKAAAKRIRENGEALVVIGIGGSYLGARAAIELLKGPRHNETGNLKIYFIGNGIGGEDIAELLQLIRGKSLYVNVISKSGTTLEPAIAFRIFRDYLEKTYGKDEAARRIFATTDKSKGALRELSDENGYETFVVPDDVGGRYSVLTAVGLLPIAAAGIDIDRLMKGAAAGMANALEKSEENAAAVYALSRQALYKNGKKVEILSYPGEAFRFMAEWFKQLYGESEGKEHMGIFPSSCELSADLHSLGQYIQDGERILFESILRFQEDGMEISVPYDGSNKDGLNYVAGKNYSDIFKAAAEGVKQAHISGGVPVIDILCGKADEEGLGELICFFETACAISGYVQGVNPFDQPGVEEYKKNMFRLLGKPEK